MSEEDDIFTHDLIRRWLTGGLMIGAAGTAVLLGAGGVASGGVARRRRAHRTVVG